MGDGDVCEEKQNRTGSGPILPRNRTEPNRTPPPPPPFPSLPHHTYSCGRWLGGCAWLSSALCSAWASRASCPLPSRASLGQEQTEVMCESAIILDTLLRINPPPSSPQLPPLPIPSSRHLALLDQVG